MQILTYAAAFWRPCYGYNSSSNLARNQSVSVTRSWYALLIRCPMGLNHLVILPTLYVVALILLAGCASWAKIPVTTCLAYTPPTLAELAEAGREVYEEVDTWPTIIGGLRSAQARINYPPTALKAKVEGRVVVNFIVNKQGRVEDAIVTE